MPPVLDHIAYCNYAVAPLCCLPIPSQRLPPLCPPPCIAGLNHACLMVFVVGCIIIARCIFGLINCKSNVGLLNSVKFIFGCSVSHGVHRSINRRISKYVLPGIIIKFVCVL
jgi:hypothetical protein